MTSKIYSIEFGNKVIEVGKQYDHDEYPGGTVGSIKLGTSLGSPAIEVELVFEDELTGHQSTVWVTADSLGVLE